MNEEQAAAVRDLYRESHPDVVSFWTDLGAQVSRELTVESICGYNPQRLLTDQRGAVRRWADDHRVLSAFCDKPLGELYYPATLPQGEVVIKNPPGSRTGRYFGGRPEMQSIPVLLPGERIKLLPVPPAVDFGSLEARVLRQMIVPNITMALDISSYTEAMLKASYAASKVSKVLEEFREKAKRSTDRMILLLFANDRLTVYDRERRIIALLGSSDPRQRKRGNRLFDQWRGKRK